jgi:hypothetical protein
MVLPKRLSARVNKNEADFLRIDSQVGLTFSGIALTATDARTRTRTTNAARRAYDTIVRLRDSVVLTDAEDAHLDHNMLRLERELRRLGEVFNEGTCWSLIY